MEYNFDLVVAGCSTNCRHCYVDGGPAGTMALSDIRLCLEKLAPVLEALGPNASLTLDNEPVNHPQILQIIPMVSHLLGDHYYHHGSTTGLPLLRRQDRDPVAKAMVDAGWLETSMTLFGGQTHHNHMVRNPKAFAAMEEAARFFRDRGFRLGFSLMLNQGLIEDREAVSRFLDRHPHDFVYFAVTSYVPTDRLRAFQIHRATLEQCRKLRGYLSAWGLDEAAIFSDLERHSQRNVFASLRTGFDCRFLESKSPSQAFFTIGPDLELYYGNTGARTRALGNMRLLESGQILELAQAASPNWDYSAFYDLDRLPDSETILAQVEPLLDANYVYDTVASCLYRLFDLCGIPSILI